ncbi:Cytochrome P450 52A12 [Lasiodiplodia theobromae]|uniref:Cytochrome P450 52A12 n=1 Tax=Lasiodiplodia theobromae TaxID=45133 RepID=A0A5N5D8R0_9PEZI|nr:Cytochrome P450 52A12 [Lasiodiplodia theobromae]
MKLSHFIGIWAAAALILFKAVNYMLVKRRRSLKSQELGCKPAPTHTPGDPFGIYNLQLMLSAGAKHYLPEYMIQRVHAVSEREGRLVTTFQERVLGQKNIFTCEPKNIQALLATSFRDFELGKGRNGNFEPMLGHGIFASDGKSWEHSRAMLRPQFSRQQINDLDLEEKHVQNMFSVLPVKPDGWTDVVDLQVLFFRLTIDAATEFLFGETVGSQMAEHNGATGSEKKFTYAFDRAQYLLFRAGRYGDNYWLAHNADFRKQVKVVHEFVDRYVDLALQQQQGFRKPEQQNKQPYVFLEAIAAETQDRKELRDQLLNILLAGRDTTASLLSWLFFTLARHPHVFAKLRRAVLDDFGPHVDDQPDITFERLKSSSYLQNTLKEALRLYTVVPINQRRAAVDTSLPTGGGPDGRAPVFVPQGTEVVYSTHVMHKRKDLWGDDADVFRPERWEGRKSGWEYLPFNGGPRICIGQQFALTEAGYVVVRLLQRFEALEAEEVGEAPGYRMTLTCAPSVGVKVRLREARG